MRLLTRQQGGQVNVNKIKNAICSALDQCQIEDKVLAEQVHTDTRKRHADSYRTAGYYCKLYRQRASLTQSQLAEQAGIRQHHLSEIENNKRELGKVNAKKIVEILDCDYRRLL